MGVKFKLNFQSDSFGIVECDEPIGYFDIDLNLQQKSNGLGRDSFFSGGDALFTFTNYRNHYLEQLLYYYEHFLFESMVDLIIEQQGLEDIVLELDFATATTDSFEYFKCKVIQKNTLQIVKRRKSVKVDMFSNKDVDGNAIAPLVPQNILMLSKNTKQYSNWQQPNDFYEAFVAFGSTTNTEKEFQFNPSINMVKSDIENSLTFYSPFTSVATNAILSDYAIIKSKNNLKNISVAIKNIEIVVTTDVDNGGNGFADFSLQLRSGLTFQTATRQTPIQRTLTENQSYEFTGDINLSIDELKRDESIWLVFVAKVRQSATNPFLIPRFECFVSIKGMSVELSAESTSYNSITPSFRLVDVMRQVIKSISGLEIDAPRFAQTGEFYPNRLLNGNLLRGAKDKPFYVSLEDIEKSLPEMYGDWEISSDGKVFFGIEKDYYSATECGFFDTTQFSSMNKMYNPKFSINEFGFKYRNYQSLKEKEEISSADVVHGETKYAFNNKMVENKKEVEVEWVRDAFLIETSRRKSLEISEDTASQDDNTLFCIDTIETQQESVNDESTDLQHEYNTASGRLFLRSDNTVNFLVLGISVGSYFFITGADANNGSYIVFAVSNNTLELTQENGSALSTSKNGNRVTNYTYIITMDLIPFTNYTNQGFTNIANLSGADQYNNLRYTVRRNIESFYQSYLATCNLAWNDRPLINTWYKNNELFTARYNGITLTEKSNINPKNPILSPFMYNDIVFANVELEDFMELQHRIRSQRGFIRTIDHNGKVIKVYPQNMKYLIGRKELNIKAEEKYQREDMKISSESQFITINNETKVVKIIYEIIQEQVYVYDMNRQRLYNGVYWDKISINGAFASDKNQLIEWLNLL